MKNNRWLILALLISLGINLLVAGVVIGRNIDGPHPARMHFEWLMNEVDEETRHKLRKNMHEQMKASREERRALRQAQKSLHQAIIAEPFDEQTLKSAMTEVRAASAELQQTMHEHMAENLKTLSPEERLKVFRVLSHAERRLHGPRGPSKPPQDP